MTPTRLLERVNLTPRARLLLLLVTASLAAGIGREALVAASLDVRGFLPLPSDQLQIAYGAFTVGYLMALVLGGVLVEELGLRRALFGLSVMAAVAMAMTGLAWSLTTLMLFRFALGLAAGGLIPAGAALFAVWMPPQERGFSTGLLLAAAAGGGLLATPVVAVAAWIGAWRLAFLVLAAGGLGWVWLFRQWFHARPGEEEEDGEPKADVPEPEPFYFMGYLRGMSLPMLLAFIQSWGVDLAREWLPAYVLTFRHFDLHLATGIEATLFAATLLGAVAGGWSCDWIMQASGNLRPARQLVAGVGFLLAVIAFWVVPTDGESATRTALWLGVATFGLEAAIVPLWTMPVDVASRHPAYAASLIGFSLMMARIISPMRVVGWLHHWQPVMVIGCSLLMLAAAMAFGLRPDLLLVEVKPVKSEEIDLDSDAPPAKGAKKK